MKRVLGILITVMVMATIPSMAAGDFSDVASSDWYYNDLMYIVNDSRGILNGYPDGTYRPDGTLQVDQFIKTVVKAAGHDVENAEGYWAQSHIDKAIEEGYISEGDFSDYTEEISREAMASIVVKVMEDLETVSYGQSAEIEKALVDITSIESAKKSDVLKVYELGIITGYPDGSFKPKNTLPRREATVVLRRIIDASARKPFEVTDEPLGDDKYEAHFLGGSKWVDPVTATDEENVAEDLLLIESDDLFYDDGGNYEWDDQLLVRISYPEYGINANQINDLERLLLRRISKENTAAILDYISQKDGWYSILSNTGKEYNISGYDILIREIISFPGTEFERAEALDVRMWH